MGGNEPIMNQLFLGGNVHEEQDPDETKALMFPHAKNEPNGIHVLSRRRQKRVILVIERDRKPHEKQRLKNAWNG